MSVKRSYFPNEQVNRSIRFIFLAVLLLPLLQQAQAQPGRDDRVIRLLAEDILLTFLQRHDHGSSRPFVVGIDGPPASGKSTIIDDLKLVLESLISERGLSYTVGRFGLDRMLRPRAERSGLFAPLHGALGTSGNCDGREFRWSELLEIVAAISEGRPYMICPYDRNTGETGSPVHESQTDTIILIEGTHVLDDDLFRYIHYPIFLDIEDSLMVLARWWRDQERGVDRIRGILSAVLSEGQLPAWRIRNARRSLFWFRGVPTGLPGPFSPDVFNNPLQLFDLLSDPSEPQRRLQLVRTGGSFRVLFARRTGTQADTLPIEGAQAMDPGSLGDTPCSQVQQPMEEAGVRLIQVPHDNDCLFHSFGIVIGEALDSREKVIALLLALLDRFRRGQLSDAQKRLLGWLADKDLEREIQLLIENGEGGINTVILTWAALLGEADFEIPENLVVVSNDGVNIEYLQFTQGGFIGNLATPPEGQQMLIFNGVGSWLAGTVEPSGPGLLHSISEESGFQGDDDSMASTPSSEYSSLSLCSRPNSCNSLRRNSVLPQVDLEEPQGRATFFIPDSGL